MYATPTFPTPPDTYDRTNESAFRVMVARELQNASALEPMAAIVDADGTLADITTKFNTLLASLRTAGLLAT